MIGENIGKVEEQSEKTITVLLGREKVGAGNVHVGRKHLVKSVEYQSCGDIPTELSSMGVQAPSELE